MMTEQNKTELAEHINTAEREGKWLWNRYHDLWFSPAELRSANTKGSFVWGAVNWELREPAERLKRLEENAQAAQRELNRARAEVG